MPAPVIGVSYFNRETHAPKWNFSGTECAIACIFLELFLCK